MIKHITDEDIRTTAIKYAEETHEACGWPKEKTFGVYQQGLKDAKNWYKENNPEPKPYSDPSMKEVLDKCCKCNFKKTETHWESCGLNDSYMYLTYTGTDFCLSIGSYQAIFAAHGYFPDTMFEKDSDGNYHFKY